MNLLRTCFNNFSFLPTYQLHVGLDASSSPITRWSGDGASPPLHTIPETKVLDGETMNSHISGDSPPSLPTKYSPIRSISQTSHTETAQNQNYDTMADSTSSQQGLTMRSAAPRPQDISGDPAEKFRDPAEKFRAAVAPPTLSGLSPRRQEASNSGSVSGAVSQLASPKQNQQEISETPTGATPQAQVVNQPVSQVNEMSKRIKELTKQQGLQNVDLSLAFAHVMREVITLWICCSRALHIFKSQNLPVPVAYVALIYQLPASATNMRRIASPFTPGL